MSIPGTLSVQLYSIRDALAEDQAGALARLAEIGLRWVEPFGLGQDAQVAQRLRRDLDAAGLRVSSTHATFPRDLSQLADELEIVGTGCAFLPVPSAAPDTDMGAFAQRASLDRLADYLTDAADELGPRGITIGYHNHWWEWDDLDGVAAYQRFLDRAGPQVALELDAYWSFQAGRDPAVLVRELGARVVALHLKSGPAPAGPLDFESAGALNQVPLSEGALPYVELLAASSAAWNVLEVDHSAVDAFELLRRNARLLVSAGLATF